MMMALEADARDNIRLIDGAYTAMDNLDHNFFVGKLEQALFYCLYRTLYIGFYNDVQFLQISCLNLT